RALVDTAPILERAMAAKSGVGFIGKNTCYIHHELGSFMHLAELMLTIPVQLDAAQNIDHQQRSRTGGGGSCQRCQTHCPTGALDHAYRLNASLCLAYWTIEHRGPVPTEFWPWFRHYWFGCDICQNVCPYNRGSRPPLPPENIRLSELPDLYTVATM